MTLVEPTNEIIKVDEAQLAQRFGNQQVFEALLSRAADVFGIDKKVIGRADVRKTLAQATQMMWQYGAMPNRHLYLLPFKKKIDDAWVETYAVADSYEWRKASADQKAREMRWNYMVQVEALKPDEIKRLLESNSKNPYHKDDVGYRARVLFLHEMDIIDRMNAMAKMTGAPQAMYDPAWHYGFWRKNAEEKTDYKTKEVYYQEDNVPKGRTRDWVAQKRAEKSALAQHFELQPIDNWQNRSEASKQAAIIDSVAVAQPVEDKKYTSLPAPKKLDSFTADLLEAEPLDYVGEEDGFYTEMQGAADSMASISATEAVASVQSPEEFQKAVSEKLSDFAKGYRKDLVKPIDNVGAPIVRKNEDVSGEDVWRPILRTTVADICGWDEAECHWGASKADYVISALCVRSDGFLSAAVSRQFYIDIAKDFSLMKKGQNKDWNETRYNLVVEVGKLVDELAK